MHQSRVITEPVTSWYGSIRNSMTCVIIVAAAPSSARLTPAAVHARFGHPIYLDCRGSRGTKPPPRVTWFKNGTAVNASDRLQFDNARSVNFTCMVGCLFVCLSVCFPHDISKTDAAMIIKLTRKFSTMSPRNASILGSKGQRSKSWVTKTLHSYECWLLFCLNWPVNV